MCVNIIYRMVKNVCLQKCVGKICMLFSQIYYHLVCVHKDDRNRGGGKIIRDK